MMLNAWHLPVPPFVKQSKDQLLIRLWLTGEDPPQRIMLRTEPRQRRNVSTDA